MRKPHKATEAERLALFRQGKTLCVVCGDEMEAFGGGKTRKRYCSLKCKDRSRRQRINDDARSMGATCYRIWLALPEGDPRDQYVDWIMYLGSTGWRYAYMFRYRWSQARTVVTEHLPDGREALEQYLDRSEFKRWRVPTASFGINKKMSAYGQKMADERWEFERFVADMARDKGE